MGQYYKSVFLNENNKPISYAYSQSLPPSSFNDSKRS